MSKVRKQYTDKEKQDLIDKVIELMSTMSIAQACRTVGVAQSNISNWIRKSTDNNERYARARYDFVESIADEIMTIADKPATDKVQVQQKRVQIDARKWMLSKIAPDRYGERLTLAGDNDSPLVIGQVNRVVVHEPEKIDQ